jgi:hypothetical protein
MYSVVAYGSSLLVDSSGTLTGANDVFVNGALYNVRFVDGTCAAAYDICDMAHLAFTTESSALLASKALLDQVLLDVPGLGDFDSNPTLTSGCYFPNNCWILTPYQIIDGNFLITQTYNQPDPNQPDGYFVHQPDGPGLSISGYDASLDVNGVIARWTPVPEPSTITFLVVGFLAVVVRRRGIRGLFYLRSSSKSSTRPSACG